MSSDLNDILRDLYQIEPKLREHDLKLRNWLQKFIELNPSSPLDANFRNRLREQLMIKATELENQISYVPEQKNSLKRIWWGLVAGLTISTAALVVYFNIGYNESDYDKGLQIASDNSDVIKEFSNKTKDVIPVLIATESKNRNSLILTGSSNNLLTGTTTIPTRALSTQSYQYNGQKLADPILPFNNAKIYSSTGMILNFKNNIKITNGSTQSFMLSHRMLKDGVFKTFNDNSIAPETIFTTPEEAYLFDKTKNELVPIYIFYPENNHKIKQAAIIEIIK